ncbi:hypothetical protein D3C76_555490 [compost metagenome]
MVEAARQVAFAAGDIAEHVGQALDRPGHAACGECHGGEAEHHGEQAEAQFGEGAFGTLPVEFLLQGDGRAEQHLLRHFEQDAPRRGARNWQQGFDEAQLFAVVHHLLLAAGDTLQQFLAVLGVDLADFLAQLGFIRAVPGEQAGRADDADRALAAVQVGGTLAADLLQLVQADIDAHHADDLAVLLQREGDAGHQHAAAGRFVEIGFEDAWLAGGFRAGVPGVVGGTAGAGRGVGELRLGQGLRLQLTGRGLGPVKAEASLVVAAQGRLAGEQVVLAVQGVGFEGDVETEQFGVAFQGVACLQDQVFAQVVGVEEAFFRLVAEEQHLVGETLAVLVGIHEVALDAQGLGQTLRAEAGLRGFVEHFGAGLLYQRGAVLHAIHGKTDQ